MSFGRVGVVVVVCAHENRSVVGDRCREVPGDLIIDLLMCVWYDSKIVGMEGVFEWKRRNGGFVGRLVLEIEF
ncbi:hypothetical protein CEXT_289351 [Caerostris extrusa]|uniref:Uncharacterized protein n=1 Tax=Caerostris extrusa TaxID=172846 RepID=A0AAV4RQY5_CAEEX|nr:hypothetical protein CEXT_289351 [Caerostris extrusa]